MKHSSKKFSALLCFSLFFSGYCYATILGCDPDEPNSDPRLVQDTCILGIPHSETAGRYIRVDYTGSSSVTVCFGEGSYSVSTINAPSLLGTRTYKYSICKDLQGRNCQVVASQDVTITQQSDGTFKAYPESLSVDFSPYVDKFPACDLPWA